MGFDFSLVTAPFRMQPGLRRVAPGAPQITPATPGSRHLGEKMAVLARAPQQALCAADGFDELPVLRAIADEAARSCPGTFLVDATAVGVRCEAPLLGWAVESDRVRGDGDRAIAALLEGLPLRLRSSALLSLAFAEDFAVLDGATAAVPWLAVCLPSHWAPEEKVGRAFAEVHAPVAEGDLLRAASASLARLVTGDERWERFVWTITADPGLQQHPKRSDTAWPEPCCAGDDAEALAATASLRSERQTFIPIAGGGRAVFTILVASEPLVAAVTSADAARRLHDAIASMSPAVLAYRRLDGARDRLLRWLAARSGGASALP